ncbi:hypothetical protein B7L88_gp166 [Rhizobium phage RHEph10]|nr:hypothetical protein B7L88_gp166 [Rhizobium phage RHEph10]AGC36122.1 hypothetical protein RHEph10_gp079 [Rhizobium phage RHEph10]
MVLTVLGGLCAAIIVSLGVIKALELIRNRVDNSKGEKK